MSSLPHVRGGVSKMIAGTHTFLVSSPRAWGCFSVSSESLFNDEVFPTCVGVFLAYHYDMLLHNCLPHVRGGVSTTLTHWRCICQSSPRAWGCFSTSPCSPLFTKGLPHVRGGVSIADRGLKNPVLSSPRAWGCFSVFLTPGYSSGVFPTCVGVFLRRGILSALGSGLPHVRGGVSQERHRHGQFCRSSPRAWGCFWSRRIRPWRGNVFPTCVGVFLLS